MEVIIVTGMSGAGRTKASVWLEDQGYYCIDNMPPQLVRNFLEISMTTNMQKVAFVADIRGEAFRKRVEQYRRLRSQRGQEAEAQRVKSSMPCVTPEPSGTKPSGWWLPCGMR